jgi:putative mRNA 3-end processing factor
VPRFGENWGVAVDEGQGTDQGQGTDRGQGTEGPVTQDQGPKTSDKGTQGLVETPAGLYCPAGDFYIDPWGAVDRALITHAHGDHARMGSRAYLCATECAPIEGTDGTWVVSGDYKRAADPTCTPFEPVRCDTFVTESTFGLPIYRWDPTASVIADIMNWWNANRDAGKASVLFCYTLGKAQRLLAELATVTDRTVLVHGMMLGMIDVYREAGVHMLPVAPATERPRGTSFAGELVLAPLSARGTPWMRRLGTISDGFASGLMRVRGVRRQRAYDRGFVISDHADWPALLETIAETGASRVLATHGHSEPLARYLGDQGVDAGVMRTAWEGEGTGD